MVSYYVELKFLLPHLFPRCKNEAVFSLVMNCDFNVCLQWKTESTEVSFSASLMSLRALESKSALDC